jgi:hypothetical protein
MARPPCQDGLVPAPVALDRGLLAVGPDEVLGRDRDPEHVAERLIGLRDLPIGRLQQHRDREVVHEQRQPPLEQ